MINVIMRSIKNYATKLQEAYKNILNAREIALQEVHMIGVRYLG